MYNLMLAAARFMLGPATQAQQCSLQRSHRCVALWSALRWFLHSVHCQAKAWPQRPASRCFSMCRCLVACQYAGNAKSSRQAAAQSASCPSGAPPVCLPVLLSMLPPRWRQRSALMQRSSLMLTTSVLTSTDRADLSIWVSVDSGRRAATAAAWWPWLAMRTDASCPLAIVSTELYRQQEGQRSAGLQRAQHLLVAGRKGGPGAHQPSVKGAQDTHHLQVLRDGAGKLLGLHTHGSQVVTARPAGAPVLQAGQNPRSSRTLCLGMQRNVQAGHCEMRHEASHTAARPCP